MTALMVLFFIVFYYSAFVGLTSRSGGRQIPRPPEHLRPKETKKKKIK
jgi:hypothetical protein